MKLQFKEQDFQLQAVKAIVDCFEGQPLKTNRFTLERSKELIRKAKQAASADVLALSFETDVMEEIGIESEITLVLGVIDFWFMAGGKQIHKTVHHYLFTETGGLLAPQVSEVDEVAWFPLAEIVDRLAYPDEKKLIARHGNLNI